MTRGEGFERWQFRAIREFEASSDYCLTYGLLSVEVGYTVVEASPTYRLFPESW